MAGVDDSEAVASSAEDALAAAKMSLGECTALFRAILDRADDGDTQAISEVLALADVGVRIADEAAGAADSVHLVPQSSLDDKGREQRQTEANRGAIEGQSEAQGDPRRNAPKRGAAVVPEHPLATSQANLAAAAGVFNRIERLAEICDDDVARTAAGWPRLIATLEVIRDQAVDAATRIMRSADQEHGVTEAAHE